MSDRKELADAETIKRCVEGLKQLLEENSIAERKALIKSFVREIRVKGD